MLRGEGPVFVKAVDPMGPAAKAGLKVRRFFFDEVVDGLTCMHWSLLGA